MSKFFLSKESLNNLTGVHIDLVRVVKRAIEITKTDFKVVEGVRTLARQREYVAKGVSKTMNSKHLLQTDGFSHAVDCYPLVKGKLVIDWGKPFPGKDWLGVSSAMKQAAAELGVEITWGGDWERFKDGPHYQLEAK